MNMDRADELAVGQVSDGDRNFTIAGDGEEGVIRYVFLYGENHLNGSKICWVKMLMRQPATSEGGL